MLQTADQALHAQQDVKAYGAQPAEMARYGVQTLQNLRLALKIEVTRGTLSMLVQGLGAVGVAVMLVAAGFEAAQGRLTAGDFMTLMTAMVSLVPMLRQLTNVQSMLQRGISSADRLFSVMDAPSERDDGNGCDDDDPVHDQRPRPRLPRIDPGAAGKVRQSGEGEPERTCSDEHRPGDRRRHRHPATPRPHRCRRLRVHESTCPARRGTRRRSSSRTTLDGAGWTWVAR